MDRQIDIQINGWEERQINGWEERKIDIQIYR